MNRPLPWKLADADYRPESLDSAPWREAGLQTGDGRYFVVAHTLEAIEEEFQYKGAIPNPAFDQIWDALRRGLAATQAAVDPHSATRIANRMLKEVVALLDEAWTLR
jgi:hypothetical protein